MLILNFNVNLKFIIWYNLFNVFVGYKVDIFFKVYYVRVGVDGIIFNSEWVSLYVNIIIN